MKLLKLTRVEGPAVYVNPSHVRWLCGHTYVAADGRKATGSRLGFSDDDQEFVQEDIEKVASWISVWL
jgi:hypothetical protein